MLCMYVWLQAIAAIGWPWAELLPSSGAPSRAHPSVVCVPDHGPAHGTHACAHRAFTCPCVRARARPQRQHTRSVHTRPVLRAVSATARHTTRHVPHTPPELAARVLIASQSAREVLARGRPPAHAPSPRGDNTRQATAGYRIPWARGQSAASQETGRPWFREDSWDRLSLRMFRLSGRRAACTPCAE